MILEQVVEKVQAKCRSGGISDWRKNCNITDTLGCKRYISSFHKFAPANDPKVLALCIIHDPQESIMEARSRHRSSVFENVLILESNGKKQWKSQTSARRVDKSDEKPYNQT